MGFWPFKVALFQLCGTSLWYQLVMNGIRLGSYQTMLNVGLTKDKHGNFSFPKSIIAGACAGCMGASIGSPFYMVTI